jgi:lycopene beta-cyclase
VKPLPDALVIGSGPSGWLAAGVCAEEGYRTTLVAPEPEAAFVPTYCCWLDDVPTPFREAIAHVWPYVELHTDARRRVDRPYAIMDNKALAHVLRSRASNVEVKSGVVSGLTSRDGKTYAAGEGPDGPSLEAYDLVIDASGRRGRFEGAGDGPMTAQTAWGVFVEVPAGVPAPEPTFMDFRGAPGEEVPTFGYVLPMPDGTVLVEETVLAAQPPVPPESLRPALQRRLRALGLHEARVVREERVFIPMGGPTPSLPRVAVPFGAAAGMGHPATGYLLASVLRTEGRLRMGVRRGLAASSSAARNEYLHRALWPRSVRTTRQLHLRGLELLLGMDRARISGFFRSFFDTPRWCWTGYLRTDAHPWRVRAAMSSTFLLLSHRDRPWVRDAYLRSLSGRRV